MIGSYRAVGNWNRDQCENCAGMRLIEVQFFWGTVRKYAVWYSDVKF